MNQFTCPNCGAAFNEGDTFCGNCGSKTGFDSADTSAIAEARKDALATLVEHEGNIFAAAKALGAKFSIDAASAISLVNEAYATASAGQTHSEDTNLDFCDSSKPAKQELAVDAQDESAESPYIVRALIVGSDSRKKVGSALLRGAAGGLILGPIGLLAGATGKNKHTTTFMLEYSNGERETETVSNKSSRFEELCKYL